MSAVSPITLANSSPCLVIQINGSPIKDFYQVISVKTETNVDKPDYARVVIADGSVAEADFPISDSNDFVPGNKISISVGYNNEEFSNIFTGLITTQALNIQSTERSYITAICQGEKPIVSQSGLNSPPLLQVSYGESITTFDAQLKNEDNAEFVQGEVSFVGNASVKPGLTIEIAGVGNRFSGTQYITGAEQNIADGNWVTTVRFDSRRPQC